MRIRLLALSLLFSLAIQAQTTVTIDPSVTYQTIQGFGASDAWNFQYIGKYWTSLRSTIARYLFDSTFYTSGTVKGIGLSRWRFNIGAGSAEQGDSSNIEAEERRVECFLNADGTYDWTKQAGQQWFLNQAKAYGVNQLVAFVNSPPRFYTKSGRANSDNTNAYGSTNLKDGYYDEFATFLATVLKHFSDNGTPFAQLSPVNEPQYQWDEGQEGCPWKNTEIKQLVAVLNPAIVDSGLNTKLLLAEASNFNDMHQSNGNADKCDQIWKFFNASRAEYIGGYSQVMNGLCGHSYWTDGSDATIRSVREAVYQECVDQGGIELYQTEYSLLSTDYDDYLINAIFLGKIIYADLAIANVSIWDYWTAAERERYSQKNRFFLIRLIPTGGDYAVLTTGGTIQLSKNFWALGNYSLFIRPGYKRIKTTGADNLAGLMGSAFIAPDTSRMVLVYVNWSTSADTISQVFTNLPEGKSVKNIISYVTDVSYNLTKKDTIYAGSTYRLSARSITTMVVNLEKTTSLIQTKQESCLTVYPNPSDGLFRLKMPQLLTSDSWLTVTDPAGRVVYSKEMEDIGNQTIDITSEPAGFYFLKTNNGVQKLIKH